MKKLRKQEPIPMFTMIQEEAQKWEGWQTGTEVLSIYRAMQQLNDSQRKQGKRYALALGFDLCAVG